MSDPSHLSHLDADGRAKMVDVGAKQASLRQAEAVARVVYPAAVFEQILAGDLPKGGLIEVARVAGIQAAKATSTLIPMCHPLSLDHVELQIEAAPDAPELRVRCCCGLTARTGVEMEAMTGAAVAALTLYDMSKALSKGIRIEGLQLIRKSGGKSGAWTAQ